MSKCVYSPKCIADAGAFQMCGKHRQQANAATAKWKKAHPAYKCNPSAETKRRAAKTRRLKMKNPDFRRKVQQRNIASRRRRFFWNRAYNFNYRYHSALTAKQLASLWRFQKGRCALSGVALSAQNAHLDHKIPRSKGGETILSNLRWLHATVNTAKWTFTDEEFITFCQKVVAHAAQQ